MIKLIEVKEIFKMGIEDRIIEAIRKAVKEKLDFEADEGMIMLEIPKDNKNGDYSSNIAMRLTKQLKRKPQEIAGIIKDALLDELDIIESIEIAGPGFINFSLKKESMAGIINTIIEMKDAYGSSDTGKGQKVLEEYVSANPTGPLHCGHDRGAAWGDSVARSMNKACFDLCREC